MLLTTDKRLKSALMKKPCMIMADRAKLMFFSPNSHLFWNAPSKLRNARNCLL